MQTRVCVWAVLIVALVAPEVAAQEKGEAYANSAGENEDFPKPRFATRPPKPAPVRKVEAPKEIVVRFTSAPAGADVLINGEFWGSTPTAVFTRLPAGTHTVVVKKSGYVAWEQRITLVPGDDRTIVAELAVQPYDPTRPRITGN